MAKQTPTRRELANILTGLPGVISDIIHGYGDCPLIASVSASVGTDTINPNTNITIPYIRANGSFTIDWGDGEVDIGEKIQGAIFHTYKTHATYTIHITGCICISFENVRQLIDISQWGDIEFIDCTNMFIGCINFNITARDTPNLDKCRVLDKMFYGCESLISGLSDWNVKNVKSMICMFSGCESFNSDLGKWNVSSVIDMYGMFSGCKVFNSDLSNWEISQVTDMRHMFYGCASLKYKI